MARSILAIVVGYLFIGLLSVSGDMVVHSLFPSAYGANRRLEDVPLLLLTMAYVALFAITGCYIAARLAPRNPMKHALILGVLGVVTQVAMWSVAWNAAPAWFHIASLALVMPYAWMGGRLRERQLERGASQPTQRTATA